MAQNICKRCGDFQRQGQIKTAFKRRDYDWTCQICVEKDEPNPEIPRDTTVLFCSLAAPVIYSILLAVFTSIPAVIAGIYLCIQAVQVGYNFLLLCNSPNNRILLVGRTPILDLMLFLGFTAITSVSIALCSPTVMYGKLFQLHPRAVVLMSLVPLIVFYGIRRLTVSSHYANLLLIQLLIASAPTLLLLTVPIYFGNENLFALIAGNYTITFISYIFTVNCMAVFWPNSFENTRIIKNIQKNRGKQPQPLLT